MAATSRDPVPRPGASTSAPSPADQGVARPGPGLVAPVATVAAGAGALVVAAFFAMGLQSGGFGVAWPAVRADLDQPLWAVGLVLAFGTAGFLVAALANRRVLPRLGVALQLPVAGGLVAMGLALMAWSPAWWVLLVGSAVGGLGAGALEAALNTHLSVSGHTRLLNLVHGAFGVGATVGPLAVASLLDGGDRWQAGFAVLALGWVGITGGFAVVRNGWGVVRQQPAADAAPVPRGPGRVVAVIAASFAAYTAAEMSVGYLSLPLLTGRGLDEATASRWVAAYWGALTVGRLLLGSVGLRTTPGRLVAGSATVALGGVAVLWLAPTSVAPVGLVVVGAGFAGIFPALVALVPQRVGDAASPGAVGVGLAAGSVGVAVGPAVVGRVAEVAGTAAIGPSLVVATGLVLVVHLAATAVARGARPLAATTTAEWPSVVAPEP